MSRKIIVILMVVVLIIQLASARYYLVDGNNNNNEAYPRILDNQEQSSRDLDLSFSAGDPNSETYEAPVQRVSFKQTNKKFFFSKFQANFDDATGVDVLGT